MGYNGVASASKFNSTKVNKLFFLIFKRHIKKISWSIGRDMAFKWTFMNSNDTPMMFGGKTQSMHIIKMFIMNGESMQLRASRIKKKKMRYQYPDLPTQLWHFWSYTFNKLEGGIDIYQNFLVPIIILLSRYQAKKTRNSIEWEYNFYLDVTI